MILEIIFSNPLINSGKFVAYFLPDIEDNNKQKNLLSSFVSKISWIYDWISNDINFTDSAWIFPQRSLTIA